MYTYIWHDTHQVSFQLQREHSVEMNYSLKKKKSDRSVTEEMLDYVDDEDQEKAMTVKDTNF